MRASGFAFLCVLLLAGACRTRVAGYPRDYYAGMSFTAIPGVGLAAEGGKVVRRTDRYDLALEGQIVRHFWDDTDFADDDLGDPGRMTAVRFGARQALSPGSKRHATFRYGFQFYRATGQPGIVDDPGDYYGFYASAGFETELSRHWSMGPEISVAVLEGEGSLPTEVVPTFFWRFVFWP
ncbi:MAG: hypothetical protein JSU66_07125 [Deltaproteobacteria bacterium]|nr:MAG: hypothetical protein JSU66_07125 [Deltaproteobacteria bacterium]